MAAACWVHSSELCDVWIKAHRNYPSELCDVNFDKGIAAVELESLRRTTNSIKTQIVYAR